MRLRCRGTTAASFPFPGFLAQSLWQVLSLFGVDRFSYRNSTDIRPHSQDLCLTIEMEDIRGTAATGNSSLVEET